MLFITKKTYLELCPSRVGELTNLTTQNKKNGLTGAISYRSSGDTYEANWNRQKDGQDHILSQSEDLTKKTDKLEGPALQNCWADQLDRPNLYFQSFG